MMKLNDNCAVIGHGTVGQATRLIIGIPEENCYDKPLTSGEMESVARSRFVFICLPTPTVNGKTDTDVIENYIRDLSVYGFDPVFIIRSTVPIGTCEYLADKYKSQIASNPEFFSEDTAMKDAVNPDFTLVGADDTRTLVELQELYSEQYSKFIVTDTKTAEMIKYAVNVFYATKVVFANVLADLCNEKGIEYEQVKGALYESKYIGKNHLDIYHKGYRGAAGKCLGKDLDSFANAFGHPLFNLVNEINKQYLNENTKV